MKIKFSILLALTQLFVIHSLSASHKDIYDDSSIIFTYSRVAEIEKHCSSYLSLASELSPDENRGYRIKRELSFTYGDWDQENGDMPLMPFDESDLPWHRLPHTVPLKLVSFQVKDINSVHHFQNTVSLGGIMSIGISRNCSYFPSLHSSSFYMRPGLSILNIVFEGIYLVSKECEKEHLMCLLGNTTLPISETVNHDWDLFSSDSPDYSILQDDQILLVLRYPQTFNLTKRAIKGEMISLNEPGSLKYFHNVYISSQLSQYSNYQFSSDITSRSCDLHPYQEELIEDKSNALNGSEFCSFLQQVSHEPFEVYPNYKFIDGYAPQSKLGPVQPGKEISSAMWRWNHKDFKLLFQHIICEEETTSDNIKNARVSAVLRVFPASIRADTARVRTGLSGLTLSAEGTWDSLRGKLCMIGCLGVVDLGLDSEGCNSQISLAFQRVFSIKQRSVILGSISSITSETDTFFPLLFDLVRHPTDLSSLGLHGTSYLSYNYSKIELAAAIRKRNLPSKAFTLSLIKKLFLKYPALEDGPAQLNQPSSNLNVNAYAILHQSSDSYNSRIYVRMEVLSPGNLNEQPFPWSYNYKHATTKMEKRNLTNSPLRNISIHLSFAEGPSVYMKYYTDLSPLFLEGVYDSLAGDMHLIGCRKASNGGTSVEHGLDCLVEVKVQYPSETGRWLKNPTVEMTITSQRNKDDPLHFMPIHLQTFMIPYEKHLQDVAFRKLFEGVLRILISLVAVGIIFSQLRYMNANEDSIPYISLVMLSELILGYSAELIKATEILFESKESAYVKEWPCDLHENQLLMKSVKFPTRLLVLAALLLTAWQYQKVSEAKSRPNAYGSNKPKRIPHSENVIQRNLKIHIGVCLILLGLRVIELLLRNDLHLMDAIILPGVLMRAIEMQVLWCQDFFLLPQIFENSLWKTQVKPLRKMYYVGLTLLKLILYFYNYIRDPVSDPYSADGLINQVDSDFFSISGIIAAPIIMTILASVVYIQQSWNYLKQANH